MDLEKEQLILDDIVSKTKDIILEEEEEIELLKNSKIDQDRKLDLIYNKEFKINTLNNSIDNPYFARLNVTLDDEEKDIYIGKNSISRDDEFYVTDWRAPISSLYYDSDIGKCSYQTIDNVIECNLNLKRQYEIEKSKVLNYYDVDLVSKDELLNKYLNENNDSRLKTIVSTIQKEQNEVIRKKISNDLIIQGVAGSGKTTVALHRIAYLVYNYQNLIKDNEYLVIGPNEVFLKYIESVLPDLNVNRVRQFTYCNFVRDYLNEDILIKSNIDIDNNSITHKDKEIANFKTSMKYKNMIDLFIKDYIENIFTEDLKLDNITLITKSYIKNEFYDVYDRLETSIDIVIDNLIERLVKYIKDRHDNILKKYNDINMELYNSEIDINKKEILKDNMIKTKNEINKYCRNIIRKYFNKINYNASKVYKKFINNIEKYNIFDFEYIDDIKNNEELSYEDAASLLYIKHILKVNKSYEKIRHTVIDEAQDYNIFNFYAIKNVLKTSSFSIYGDIAQGIYDYRSIKSWDEVNNIMFNNTGDIINFRKSYRTTKNIMEVADKVIESIGLSKSELVVRTGDDVKYINTKNNIDYIINRVSELKEKGYKTIAIISKNNKLSINLNNKLKEKGLDIPNMTESANIGESSVCTLSTYMSKGLEFDAVIINGCSNELYKDNIDMKLLYIAITRALQSVDIIYDDDLCNCLC